MSNIFIYFKYLLFSFPIYFKYLKFRDSEKILAIRYLKITYICLCFIFIFGLINTTWISLQFEKLSKENEIYKEFGLAVVFDYFVYEIIILLSKSFIYFVLIKDDFLPWWKKFLISFISAMPWVNIFLN